MILAIGTWSLYVFKKKKKSNTFHWFCSLAKGTLQRNFCSNDTLFVCIYLSRYTHSLRAHVQYVYTDTVCLYICIYLLFVCHFQVSPLPCHSAGPYSCKRPCGRLLNCQNHTCMKECHHVTKINGSADGKKVGWFSFAFVLLCFIYCFQF